MTISLPEATQEYLLLKGITDGYTVLDTQQVQAGAARTGTPTTWSPAEWVGPPGVKRDARWLYDLALPPGRYAVYVRVVTDTQTPIIRAGSLSIS